ncbi:MAG: FAD-dependent thymidylate synthase [Christensenellales bacterium]|jgi:thymidylate synthase (FAD)
MSRVYMKVELLAMTPSPDEIVAMAARLCYSSADIDKLKSGVAASDRPAFIKRLIDMGHLSTIEHCSFSFGIEGVSRALLAQITRHRLASFSVQSQRYVSEIRQSGVFNYIMPPQIAELGEEAQKKYDEQMRIMQSWYNEWNEALGSQGEKSNEDARFVLPNAAETKMIMTMNARELIHFFKLRCCERAQWEIRELAWRMLEIVAKEAPALFEKAGPSCVSGRCSEGKMSCGKAAKIREKREKLNYER